jgi:hypothetical protein
MERLVNDAVIDRCGKCNHCFDSYAGEYDKPFVITPEDYKHPECDNLPMTNDGTFPEVDVNKLRPDCPLHTVEVITDEETIGLFEEAFFYDEFGVDSIILVKKDKEVSE